VSKYAPLAQHLENLDVPSWKAGFSELEKILGFRMPGSAYAHKAWWSNAKDAGHSQSAAWQAAGWRSGAVDLGARTVTFFRAGGAKTKLKSAKTAAKPPVAAKPPIAAAPKVAMKPKLAAKSVSPAAKPKLPAAAPATASVGLTISEAKAGLAKQYGVSLQSVEITIKG
jgi:hypothetical protein